MKRADGAKLQPTAPEHVAYIVEHWATQTCGEIEAATGVRRGTVKAIASKLGLEKDRDALTAIRSRAGSHPHDRSKWRSHRSNPWRMLGVKPVELPSIGGRVHRIMDDDLEELAA